MLGRFRLSPGKGFRGFHLPELGDLAPQRADRFGCVIDFEDFAERLFERLDFLLDRRLLPPRRFEKEGVGELRPLLTVFVGVPARVAPVFPLPVERPDQPEERLPGH